VAQPPCEKPFVVKATCVVSGVPDLVRAVLTEPKLRCEWDPLATRCECVERRSPYDQTLALHALQTLPNGRTTLRRSLLRQLVLRCDERTYVVIEKLLPPLNADEGDTRNDNGWQWVDYDYPLSGPPDPSLTPTYPFRAYLIESCPPDLSFPSPSPAALPLTTTITRLTSFIFFPSRSIALEEALGVGIGRDITCPIALGGLLFTLPPSQWTPLTILAAANGGPLQPPGHSIPADALREAENNSTTSEDAPGEGREVFYDPVEAPSGGGYMNFRGWVEGLEGLKSVVAFRAPLAGVVPMVAHTRGGDKMSDRFGLQGGRGGRLSDDVSTTTALHLEDTDENDSTSQTPQEDKDDGERQPQPHPQPHVHEHAQPAADVQAHVRGAAAHAHVDALAEGHTSVTSASTTPVPPSPPRTAQETRAHQLTNMAFAKREKLLEFALGEEGWTDCGIREGVQLGRHDIPHGPAAVRGRLNFGTAFTAKQVADYILLLDRKHEWDGMFDKGHLLHVFCEHLFVVYQAFKPQLGVAGRDFVLLGHRFEDPSGRVTITTTSIDWGKPPEHALVRADLHVAGYVLQPLPDGTLHVTYVNHVDVKGNIPSFVIRMVQTKQPLTLAHIKRILDTHGPPPPLRPESIMAEMPPPTEVVA